MNKGSLRICRVIQDLLPPEKAYGYYVSFYQISKEQRDDNQEILIIKPSKTYQKTSVENFPIVSVPLRKRGVLPLERKRFISSVRMVLRSWNADIIHAHVSAGCYLHGTKMLPPTVHHLHGLPYQAIKIWEGLQKIKQKSLYFRDMRHDFHVDMLYRTYLKRANAVVVCCPSLKPIVLDRYRVPPEKVHVVYNGISSSFLRSYSKSAVREELGLKDDYFLILFVGRLIAGKGLIPLLKALSRFKSQNPTKKIKLLTVGSKFGAPRLQSLVRSIASRDNSIIEIPHVSYDSMPKYYTAADVHVLGHTFGLSFPKTCLESLACGTPVIMTKNPDAEVIIGQNKRGYILNNPLDHVELAKKIMYIMENEKEAKEMGKRGKALISKNFTWKKTIEKLNTVYHKVLEDQTNVNSM